MKKAYLSPVTSFLMSLLLVAGIFVAGLTNSSVLPAAKAQTIQYVTVGAPDATLMGTFIVARGIIVNGVASDALIPSSVRISNSDVDSACGLTALGFTATGDMVYALGVYTSGNDEGGPDGVYTSGNDNDGPNGVYTSGNDNDGPNGVYTSGNDEDSTGGPNGVYTSGNDEGGPNGVYTSGNVYVGDSLQVVGGVLSGNNIQIIDGVISGSSLQVTGGYVTSACGN